MVHPPSQDRSPWASVNQLPYCGKYGIEYVSKESIAYLRRNGVAVLAWVVDDPADMKLLVEGGVDGTYTRRPDRLGAAMNNR